jgi:tripartite-type tricarboxylate transporter receptor subunit TctC
MARLVADRLSAELGQPAVVEHRPGGAGGSIGAKSVAAADPDGYTLLVALVGTITIAPALYKNVGYDSVTSFAPVALISVGPQIVTVNPAIPARSLPELVAYAKSNPGKLTFASPGVGTQPHLLGAIFKSAAGVDILHVPYRGSAPAITDLLAGQVQMMIDTTSVLMPHIEAGKVIPLAVTTETRHPQLPAVPTVAEAGLPQLTASVWSGIVAPAGTPAAVVAKLNATINEGLTSPEIKAALANLGLEPKPLSPQAFAAFVAAEAAKWAEVVKANGIKVE